MVLFRKLPQTAITDVQQCALFKIGSIVSPPSFQVVENPDKEIVFYSLFVFQIRPSGIGRGNSCILLFREVQLPEHLITDSINGQPVFRGCFKGMVNCRAHHTEHHKVIEMTCLKRCILPVICKTQEFLTFSRNPLSLKGFDNAERNNRCCRTSSFIANPHQLGVLVCFGIKNNSRGWVNQ